MPALLLSQGHRDLPHNPSHPEEVGGQLLQTPPSLAGPGQSEAPPPTSIRPALFTLGDELLLSLSAVLALLFVFKSSYNFAPGFIANSIYLLLPRVST